MDFDPNDTGRAVRQVVDVYNSHRVDAFDDILAEDCVMVRNGIAARGRDAVKSVLAKLYIAIPDIEYRVDDAIASGNKLAMRWSGRGTHSGEYMGVPPTNKPIEYDGMTIYELRDGKIASIWVSANVLAFLRAAGVRAPSPQPEARA